MQFQCTKQELLPAINLVERAVAPSNTNLPIITGINIQAKNNEIKLTSTNLELGIETKFMAHIIQENELVVNGKLFAALVRKLPDKPIVFELIDNNLVITAGTVEFSLTTFTNDDFPDLPFAAEILFKIEAQLLLKMIKNTIFACGKDEKRPFVNGILFELEGSTLNFVATDINRLAYFSHQVNVDIVEPLRLLVPMKTFQEIQHSLPNDDTEVTISYFENSLIFEVGNNKVTSRLIDDRFPNYQSLFPKEESIVLTINRQLLTSAVERASLFPSDDGTQVVIFDAESGVLEIRTPTSSKGKSVEKIGVEHQGEGGMAAFSANYILDMLKATNAEDIIFSYNTDLRQCSMKVVHGDEQSDNQLYVLMPIRI